jgi:uncharacterized membrane protein
MYAFCKTLHILGLVLMLGNVTVTALWKVFADRSCKTQIMAFAQWLVTVTDFSFTLSGGFLMVAGGYGAVYFGDLPLTTPWLLVGQIMMGAAGAVWLGVLVPIQIKQAAWARDFAITGDIPPAYTRASATWLVWGLLSTVPLGIGMWVMVAKPALWW